MGIDRHDGGVFCISRPARGMGDAEHGLLELLSDSTALATEERYLENL